MRKLLLGLAALLLVLFETGSRGANADEARVTRVLVSKSSHLLSLYAGERLVASYHSAIGPGGPGPKRKEGDMTTPVGRYRVTMHQPSQYTLFLRLDYPNAEDRARFEKNKREGNLPASARIGGDIGIHGPPVGFASDLGRALNERDWTAGCIAVNADEIVEIGKRVRDGTVVDIEE